MSSNVFQVINYLEIIVVKRWQKHNNDIYDKEYVDRQIDPFPGRHCLGILLEGYVKRCTHTSEDKAECHKRIPSRLKLILWVE